MTQRKIRWLKRLAKAAGIAAAVIAVLAVAGKWWLAPALLRWRISRLLPEYWDGSAEIADVDFNYTGSVPITLRGLALHDRRGRCWLRAKSVRFVLSDWPSLRPKLGALIVVRPTVTAHREGGRCEVPLRRVPWEWWDEYVDLKGLSIETGSLELTEDGTLAARSAWGDLSLLWGPRGYRLSMPAYRLLVTDILTEAFAVEADGVEVRRLTGRTCGGRVVASMTGRLMPGGRVRAGAQVVARAVDLAAMRLPVRGAEKGSLTGALHLRADGADPNGVTGYGTVFVEGADLRNVPALAEILRRAGLGKLDVMSDSDIEARFRLRGATASLEQARIRLALAAIDVEPGSTLDLRTGRMDIVAVVALFERVRDMLKSIPLVSLMVDLTEGLSRFHVEGKWHDPQGLVITPAPLRAVRKASMRFLAAAARGGSELGKAVLNGVSGALNPPDPNAPTTNRTERE
ncbi:MAG: hypothetical protein WBF17_21230 [Phycisphaerae bacterium]